MERRQHHRAMLRLPVRLRWTTPFGQKTEVRETLNASRGGLQVACEAAHDPGVPVWVTFPFDISASEGQPEVLARVVRTVQNGKDTHAVHDFSIRVHGAGKPDFSRMTALGLRLEVNEAHAVAHGGRSREHEQRASARVPVALLIRVRPAGMFWFEEAMTLDVSGEGIRFLTNREYSRGQELLVRLWPDTVEAPVWAGSESTFRVVRVEASRQLPNLAVSLQRAR